MPGGDLCQKLSKTRFGWRERLFVALETTQAVAYLHGCRPKVFHRDITAANILLNQYGTAKLADFGLACVADNMSQDSRNVKRAEGTCTWSSSNNFISGTPGYADPQYVKTLQINEPREVYSLGMLYLELLTSQPPAAYVTNTDGERELRYLLDELDIMNIESIFAAIDPLLDIPTPVARSWGSLALR